MTRLIGNFDALSFWIGVLAGIILYYLLGRLRPVIEQLSQSWNKQLEKNRQEKLRDDRVRIGNDTLLRCQGMHLATSLFPLDEILIPPRLLMPAIQPMAYQPEPYEDITDWILPHTLDFPELASYYGAPSFSCARALQGGANILIVAEPGQGKTTCLAHLTTQFLREDPELGELSEHIPLLLHIADLSLPPEEGQTALDTLVNAISPYIHSIPTNRLPATLQAACAQNKIILLLDGLDEIAPEQMKQSVNFLESLTIQYPQIRMVACAAPYQLGGLLELGFHPLAVKNWSAEQKLQFINTWGNFWNQYISDTVNSPEEKLAPLLVTGWLSNNIANLTPLELTLKIWAAFAGNALGPHPADNIEAYLQHSLFDQARKNRLALQQLALQMTLRMQAILTTNQAENWLSGSELSNFQTEDEFEVFEEHGQTSDKPGELNPLIRARNALPNLCESGILVAHPNGSVTFSHVIFSAYLSSQNLHSERTIAEIIAQPEWSGKRETLHYQAAKDEDTNWIKELIQSAEIDPILSGLFCCAKWLRDTPSNSASSDEIMRQLATTLQMDNTPLGLKMRALSALVFSGKPGIAVLTRKWLQSDNPLVQQFACLGCGVLQDAKSSAEIENKIGRHAPGLARAAILALVAIGNPASLEAVAYHLLNGSESIQRAAAEGLANNAEEGYPTLKEGSQLDDPTVRRAVVFGLARIQETWSLSLLEDLRTNDPQWVVQDAAVQAIRILTETHPRAPRPLPALTLTPWLIDFAGEHGMAVTPGKPAYELLYNALQDGDEDQRLAALYFLSLYGDESAALPLLKTYHASSGDVREAAFEDLVRLAGKGFEIPPLVQNGLH